MTQLENFIQETGSRFRMTKDQTARVALTTLSVEDRASVAAMSVEDAAAFFKAVSPKGKPLGWVKKAVELAGNWRDELTLTRPAAFQEFLASRAGQRLTVLVQEGSKEERFRFEVPQQSSGVDPLSAAKAASSVSAPASAIGWAPTSKACGTRERI
jgi:hypothetical protein